MTIAKSLPCTASLDIFPSAPFDFDSTVHKPDHFPSSDCRWQPGRRWQTMLWQGETLGLILENAGEVEQPRVRLHVFSEKALPPEFVQGLSREIEYRYNLALDLRAFYDAMGDDALVAPAFARLRGLRPMNPGSLYEYLVVAIVLQNATVRRSVSMMQALFERYGILLRYDAQEFYCAWQPQVLATASEQELRALRVGYRARSLLRVSGPLAAGIVDETVLRQAAADVQKEALLSLYGIGPASVGYIMTDVFHRWDFLEHISPWEQKICTKLFFDRDYHQSVVAVRDMLEHFEQRFGRWKALAVHYIWEDLWWKRRNEHIPWLEELIRL